MMLLLSMKKKSEIIHFGDNLRRIREQQGYTMSRLAEMTGISKRMISHYETQVKRPALDKIQKLADALKVSINDLMGPPVEIKIKNEMPYKLMKKVRVIEQLPTRDQNAIFRLINSLAEKNKIKSG